MNPCFPPVTACSRPFQVTHALALQFTPKLIHVNYIDQIEIEVPDGETGTKKIVRCFIGAATSPDVCPPSPPPEMALFAICRPCPSVPAYLRSVGVFLLLFLSLFIICVCGWCSCCLNTLCPGHLNPPSYIPDFPCTPP